MGQIEIPRAMLEPESISHMRGSLKLLAKRLYQEGDDGILRLCIEP